MVLFYFFDRYKNVFSQNLLTDRFANLFSYGKSTFRKDFSNRNYSKVIERIKEKDEYFAKIFENIIQIVFENKNNYKGIGDGKVFELLPNNLKDFKNLWIIQKNIIEEKKIGNYEVLGKFLNKDEIKDLINKEFKYSKIIILKFFHYQFCLYASNFFRIDYEKFIISFFKANQNICSENLLKFFFKSSYCYSFNNENLFNNEKRNIRNIINQKNIMKFETFKTYFNGIEYEENKELLYLIYYALYLYIDFLEFLKKELKIDKNIFCKFIEEIKRRN